MWLYRNNIVLIHAALVACAFAWIWGGMRGPELVPIMPWLWAFLAEVMLCFPERHSAEESTYQARERVWKAMKCDPLVWVEVGFLLMLVIPFVNNGLCPGCDAAAIAEGVDPSPPIGFLPYCVSRLNHLSVFLWFLPTLTMVTAVKHSLTKSGKRLFCEMLVWNAALLALLGFIQQVANAPGPLWWSEGVDAGRAYFFSTFGYPNAGGAFFTSAFALSVGIWRRHADDVRREHHKDQKRRNEWSYSVFWRKHYMVIPTLLIFFAAINTLSRAAIAIVSSSAFLLAVHAMICTLWRLKRAARVKAGAMMGLGVVLLAILVTLFTPEKVRDEMNTIRGSHDALDRFTSKNEYHSRVAMDLFWEHPLFGCGGWGYAHLSPTKMTEEELASRRGGFGPGSANVHNDYLQFMAEHGIVGFGCLVAIAVMLLLPSCAIWARLYRETRFEADRSKLPPKPRTVFALPAGAFAVLIGALAILIHAFADCPLRSPAVLALFYGELAALPGFLPRVEIKKEESHS